MISKKNVSFLSGLDRFIPAVIQGRLMYVAITRAKRYLHLSYSDTRSNYGQQEDCQRSQFISEIPTHLVAHASNENDRIYQPPKKKMPPAMQHGFVSGMNLFHMGQANKTKF